MPDSKTESGLTDRPRVVLDANVLYGLPLRDTLLTLASEPMTWPRMLVGMERARLSKFAARLRR
jgi:hypothetical protein